METLILNATDIARKITRMAYEIAEQNADENALTLVGIRDRGYELALRLQAELKNILHIPVELHEITLDKIRPAEHDIRTSLPASGITGRVLVFVDDVANSGKTLLYAMKPLLEHLPKKVSVAVLIDRKHKQFPVSPDIVGLTLSTNMQEHVNVKLGEQEGVYLS